jgi:hypothetical protein
MWLHAERAGERFEGGDTDVALAALDAANIGPVVAADVGQRLLRKFLSLPQPPHIRRDNPLQPASPLAPFRHAAMGAKCTLLVYTL